MQEVPDAQPGAARRDQAAPDADRLLDRLQRAAEQDVRRKHYADGRHLIDDQIGAEPENERLHRETQEFDQALHGGGAVACHYLSVEHAEAVPAPALQKAVGHAHRPNHLGVAQAHLGEAVVPRRRLVGFRQGPAHEPLVGERHQQQQHGAAQREEAEKRMQNKDDADIDRRPRQVEDGVDAGAGNELTEGVEVAQRLAAWNRRRR